jgi:hypothetical protein
MAVLVIGYIGTFSYLWLRSPSYVGTSVQGWQCKYVDFHFDNFSYRTRVLWIPAFWFMEKVCGYEDTAEVLAGPGTIIYYGKRK